MLDKDTILKTARAVLLAFTCLLLAIGSRSLLAQDTAKIKDQFRNPPKQYRPMVRWWWPGADVTDNEIQREIGLLDAAGFGGAEIQPFATFDTRAMPKAEAEKVNSYATPEFFKHVKLAADQAKSCGMWMDYTFGSGWPFGGGLAITPELSAIELRYEDNVFDGPKAFAGKLTIPDWKPGLIASMMLHGGIKPDWPSDWQARMDARSKVIAVVAIRSVPAAAGSQKESGPRKPELLDRGSAVVLTDRMGADGTLDWQIPDGTWHIFVFRQIPTRQPVIGAAGNGPQLVLDHLDKKAFEAHADRVGTPLVDLAAKDVGKSLRAIFCDSLELQQYLFWSDDFIEQFKKRRGYDLTPYLAILRQPGYNDFYFSHPGGLPLFDVADGGDAIRRDYWKTISELIFEGFYHPFDEWAKQHRLLSRVQAHGAPADLLKLYGDASIPETEQLDGDNTVNFMKLASSAGYDYGKKIVSSESFVFCGNTYIATPESIKANSDKLFVSGVNEIIYHGFPYKFDDGTIKGIGWFPFQGQFSSHIAEDNPIWPFIGKVNGYITRMQYIMHQGNSDLQVAIFRSALNEEDMGPTPASGVVKDPFPSIEEKLTAAGYSFGFVNEDVLLGSSVTESSLRTKTGGRYAALIIPRETSVTPELVKALNTFADGPFPIVFVGGRPGANVSFKNLDEDQALVAKELERLSHAASAIHVADGTEAAANLTEVVPAQVRFVSGAILPFVKKTIGSASFYLLTNPAATSSTTTVEIPAKSVPEVWDAWSGDARPVNFTREGGAVRIAVALPPFGSELIAFDPSQKADVSPSSWNEIKRQTVGGQGWSVDAVGDSEKGVGIALHLSMPKLIDWLDDPNLKTFSGRAVYVTHVSVSSADLKGAKRIILDLGELKDAAEVKVNGVQAAALVVHPFSADIRSLLHEGDNTIQVTVVNSLTNFVSTIQWPKNSPNPKGHFPAISAGLFGPVVLEYQTSETKK
jgi:hypothetical protein